MRKVFGHNRSLLLCAAFNVFVDCLYEFRPFGGGEFEVSVEYDFWFFGHGGLVLKVTAAITGAWLNGCWDLLADCASSLELKERGAHRAPPLLL